MLKIFFVCHQIEWTIQSQAWRRSFTLNDVMGTENVKCTRHTMNKGHIRSIESFTKNQGASMIEMRFCWSKITCRHNLGTWMSETFQNAKSKCPFRLFFSDSQMDEGCHFRNVHPPFHKWRLPLALRSFSKRNLKKSMRDSPKRNTSVFIPFSVFLILHSHQAKENCLSRSIEGGSWGDHPS